MASDKSEPWKVPLVSLGNNLIEARELAAVLEETLGVRVDYGTVIHRSATTSQLRGHTFKERLQAGIPTPIDERSIKWSSLRGVVSTESLKDTEAERGTHPGHTQIEVNSGGRVFVCFFAPSSPVEPEGVAVLKFGPNRLLMQAEQFANELTRHLDICAPDCRIVRQAGPSSEEWRALSEACVRLGSGGSGGGGSAAELASELAQMPVALLMEYCPGRPLLQCDEAFRPPEQRSVTFEDLGRLFLLDAVLGNADRLPCGELRWRGNPNNVLFGRAGSRCASHIVAIDSCVQRRPPLARVSAEDAGVDRLAQLLLTDQECTLELLRGSVLAHSPPGLAALAAAPAAAADAFRRGFRDCLRLVERIKGLLEMMYSKMDEWSVEFIKDIKQLRPELPIPNPTPQGSTTAAGLLGGGGGSSSGGRLVAHYTGLNIRVSPAAGSSVGGGVGVGGAGAGGSSSSRNRSQLGWGGVVPTVNSSGVGSPARGGLSSPFPPLSPYNSTARTIPRSRNPSLGGGGGGGGGGGSSSSSLVDGKDLGMPHVLWRRRRGSLGGAVVAAAKARDARASATAITDGGGQVAAVDSRLEVADIDPIDAVSGGKGDGGGRGASLRFPFTAAAATSGGGGGGASKSPRYNICRGLQPHPLQRLQQEQQQVVQSQRQRNDGLVDSLVLGSSGSSAAVAVQPHHPHPQQRIKPCGSEFRPPMAVASAEMSEGLARSPYLISAPHSGGRNGPGTSGGLGPLSGEARRLSTSVCISSRSVSVSGGNSRGSGNSSGGSGSGSTAGAGKSVASSGSPGSSNSSGGGGGDVGGPVYSGGATGVHLVGRLGAPTPHTLTTSTPQSRLAVVTASAGGEQCTDMTALETLMPCLPHQASRSPREGGFRGGGGSAEATPPQVGRVMDVGGGGRGTSDRGGGTHSAARLVTASLSLEAPENSTSRRCSGVQSGGLGKSVSVAIGSGRDISGGPGQSAGNSPLRPGLRIRSSVKGGTDGGGGGGGGAVVTPLLRHSRSFGGLLRSPRRSLHRGNSPRRSLCPSTPKFRSPLVDYLQPPAADVAAVTVEATNEQPAAFLQPPSLNSAPYGVYCSDGGAVVRVHDVVVPSAAAAASTASVAALHGRLSGTLSPPQLSEQPPPSAASPPPSPPGTTTTPGTAVVPCRPPLPRAGLLRTPSGPSSTAMAAASAAPSAQMAAAQATSPFHGLQIRRQEPDVNSSQGTAATTSDAETAACSLSSSDSEVISVSQPPPKVLSLGELLVSPSSSPPLPVSISQSPGDSPVGHFFREADRHHHPQPLRNQQQQQQQQQCSRLLEGGQAANPATAPSPTYPDLENPFCFRTIPIAAQVGSLPYMTSTPTSTSTFPSPPPFSAITSTQTIETHATASSATPPPLPQSSRLSSIYRTPTATASAPMAATSSTSTGTQTPCTPAHGDVSISSDAVCTTTRTIGATTATPPSITSVRTSASNMAMSRRYTAGGRGGRVGGSGGMGGGSSGGALRSVYGTISRGNTPSGLGRLMMARNSPAKSTAYDQFKSDMSLTLALKSITSEARKDDLLSSRVAHWKELFRTRGEELKAAVGEWQLRHQLDKVLTTGFLDGTHPIVDTYELKVRLEHMLRRLQVLQEAAGAEKPSQVLGAPRALFLGGAVAADSHHILRHLGITHIINATEELLLPDPSAGFVVLRVALRDVDDEDIACHFTTVSEFIQCCHSSGGSMLVHCSEGKSRSVTLVLVYLMRERGWRLKAAFDHVKSCRPVACPNAGFMAKLLLYERDLFGCNSYIPQPLKKPKPEPVMCSICGAAVGISSASLGVHLKRVHPSHVPQPDVAAPRHQAQPLPLPIALSRDLPPGSGAVVVMAQRGAGGG